MKKRIVSLILIIASSVNAYQASIDVPNGTGAQVRTNMNNALKAITTLQSGASAPSTTYAYQLWVDTSTSPPTLKSRKGDNTAWVTLGTINDSTGKFIADDSKTVGTFTPSQTPGANQVPVLDNSGFLKMGADRVIAHTSGGLRVIGDEVSNNLFTSGGTTVFPVNATSSDLTTWNRSNVSVGAARIDFKYDGSLRLFTTTSGSGPITWSGPYSIWHSGNDGTGSGLDADLLDGQHGAYYQPASTAINVSNIASQSVSSATNSNASGTIPYYRYENGIRELRGTVISGSLTYGAGFSVNNYTTGRYRLTYSNAFSSRPSFSVTSAEDASSNHFAVTYPGGQETTNCEVTITNNSGALTNGAFHILIQGPN